MGEVERLRGSHVPDIGRRHAVAEQERPERAGSEAQDDCYRVLHRKAASGITGLGLHAGNIAADEAQCVDVVDQIDEQRPSTGLPPP